MVHVAGDPNFVAWANGVDTSIAAAETAAHARDTYQPINVLVGAGIDPTGVTDSTTAIQAKIDAATTAGEAVFAPPGTYRVAGLVIRDYASILGAGSEITTFKLPDGGSGPVFVSYDFAALTGGSTDGGVAGVKMSGFTIDGNKTADLAGTWGIQKYGYRWQLDDIVTRDCVSGGIYSEWSAIPGVGADGGFMEDLLVNVRVFSNTGYGIQWRGPHDSRMDQTLIYANGGHGLSIEGSDTYHAGGIVLDMVHSYGNGGNGVQVISTNNQGAAIVASSLISESNTGTGLVLGANGSVIASGSFYANLQCGIDIQSFAAGYSIQAQLQNNSVAQIKFTNDGGNAVIVAAAYTASGGQVGVSGSHHASTMLQISGTGNGTNTSRLSVLNALVVDSVSGTTFGLPIADGPTVDLTGRTSLDGREILKAQNGTGAYYQITTDKKVNVENAAGTKQDFQAGAITADTGLTASGLIYFADGATFHLPRTASTSSGYFWYDATTGLVTYRDGVASLTRGVATNNTDTTTNLASVGSGVNTLGKFAGKQVWNTSSSRPVWASGSSAASVWVFSDGTTAHTPV